MQAINLASFVLCLLMNAFVEEIAVLYGGVSHVVIARQTKVGVMPAGFTFSIWGIIYLLLLVFTVY